MFLEAIQEIVVVFIFIFKNS